MYVHALPTLLISALCMSFILDLSLLAICVPLSLFNSSLWMSLSLYLCSVNVKFLLYLSLLYKCISSGLFYLCISFLIYISLLCACLSLLYLSLLDVCFPLALFISPLWMSFLVSLSLLCEYPFYSMYLCSVSLTFIIPAVRTLCPFFQSIIVPGLNI